MQNTGREITQKSKTNFLYSFSLLPKEKNDAINTIYAFCRKTDDIVDNENRSHKEKENDLAKWKQDFESSRAGNSDNTLLNELSKVIKRFKIPTEPFTDLIRGMKMDLEKTRYETFEELYEYCYCAAGTVGLMSIEIFGYSDPATRDFAVKLGVALQLTNILRDVKKDAENGRIYLPLDDMEMFNYTEDELLNNVYNNNFIALMKYEADRAHKYYKEANELLTAKDTGLMFPARIMEHIYFDILRQIEMKKYDVYSNNIKVSKFKKLLYTFGIYLKCRLYYSMKDPRDLPNG